MGRASDYPNRLQWLTVHRSEDGETGEWKGTHDYGPKLWASVEEISGTREQVKGGEQTGAQADIRIRSYPDVSALDILLDLYTGYVWHVDSISNGDNELVVAARRFDELIAEELGSG